MLLFFGLLLAIFISPATAQSDLLLTEISAARFHTCGLFRSTVSPTYCWGFYSSPSTQPQTQAEFSELEAALGDGYRKASPSPIDVVLFDQGNTSNPTPVQVSWADIRSGCMHTCALTINGEVYCMGDNEYGQRGIGIAGSPTADEDSFYRMLQTVNYNNETSPPLEFNKISVGCKTTCGTTKTGAVLCWGSSAYGKTGTPTGPVKNSTSVTVPTFVANPFTGKVPKSEDEAKGIWIDVETGAGVTCGINASREAFCWGDNSRGSLGNGNVSEPVALPQPVAGNLTWSALSTTVFPTIVQDNDGYPSPFCGISTEGDLFCWGDDGLFTNSTSNPNPRPTLVNNNGVKWSQVSVGSDHVCGIEAKTNVLKCWGRNDYLQLGVPGPNNTRPTPEVALEGLLFEKVSAGYQYTCGILLNLTAVCWGKDKGALGNGDKMSWGVQKEPRSLAAVVKRNPSIFNLAITAQKSKTNVAVLAVPVAFFFVVLALVAVFLSTGMKRRRESDRIDTLESSDTENGLSKKDSNGSSGSTHNHMFNFQMHISSLPPEDIIFDRSLDNLMGYGHFSKVYRGQLVSGTPIAIKCIPLKDGHIRVAGKSESWWGENLLREAAVLRECRYDYVVDFWGVIIDKDELRIVTELMEGGTLAQAIRQEYISWTKYGLQIALDIACGLHCLHSHTPTLVHADLKAFNVLLTPEGRAKLSDVGLSQLMPIATSLSANRAAPSIGTFPYVALEQLLGFAPGPPADMYAYGVLLWEICTGEVPIRGQLRPPTVPDECPQEILDFMHRCWNAEASERPTATEAVELIRTFLE